MDAFRNSFEELGRIRSENNEQTDTPNNRRTSESVDSGFGSGNSSRRTSTASNNNSRPNNNNDSPPNGGDIAAGLIGIAGIALGAYAVGKFLFGGSNPPPSGGSNPPPSGGRMPRISEDEEDFLNPKYQARISKEIKKDTDEYPVVGLDCQWSQRWDGCFRNKVGLLQISSHKGNVALISLGSNQRVPPELLAILADKNIIKSGIETFQDGQKLFEDYSIAVKGTLDLRYLAEENGYKPDSLAKLAKKFLGVDLGRDFESIAADWDGPNYSQEQIDYAKKAAKASVDLFKKFISKVLWWESKANILAHCKENIDKPFVYHSERYN